MKLIQQTKPFTLLVVTLLLISAASRGGDRVALAIGVDHYPKLGPKGQLSVAVEDANRVKKTLESLDDPFNVILVENAGVERAKDAIVRFIEAARGAECALIYFAGHGIEYHGANYLLPSDIDAGGVGGGVELTKRIMERKAIHLQHLVDDLATTGANVKLVILDACRDNPLAVTRSYGTNGGGLGAVAASNGMLVSYSANTGQKANDGLFTEILCRNLRIPGETVMDVFAKTREEVSVKSREMANTIPGAVAHTPGEYNMLTRAGQKFQFQGRGGSQAREELEVIMPRRPEPERVSQRSFEALYTGEDGVNVRSTPNGTLTATLYDQRWSTFDQLPDSREMYEGGVPWIQGSLEGWMAIRYLKRSYDYAVDNGDGTLTMTWDGAGNPNDAYIALRPKIDDGESMAKIYRGALLLVIDGNRRLVGDYQWIKVRLAGWAARHSPKGTTLLREQ